MRGRAVFRLVGVIFAALASLVVGAGLLWGWLDRELMARAAVLDLFVVLGLIFLPVGATVALEIDRRLRPRRVESAAASRVVAAPSGPAPVEVWRTLMLEDEDDSSSSGARRHPGRGVTAQRARRSAARRISATSDRPADATN